MCSAANTGVPRSIVVKPHLDRPMLMAQKKLVSLISIVLLDVIRWSSAVGPFNCSFCVTLIAHLGADIRCLVEALSIG